jgi:hypothetical protein
MKQVLAAAIVIGASFLALPVAAMAGSPHGGCTLGTLSGTYVYSYTGFSVAPNHDHIPFAVAGNGTYDGHGHTYGLSTSTTTDGKQGLATPVPYKGVYTIASDCHGTEVDTDDTGAVSHFSFFTNPTGNTSASVETDYGVVSTSVQTRN